ncbi:12578_t:CDS:1, partial [Cetraspora pellucida]
YNCMEKLLEQLLMFITFTGTQNEIVFSAKFEQRELATNSNGASISLINNAILIGRRRQ